jgi:O-antigen ligase
MSRLVCGCLFFQILGAIINPLDIFKSIITFKALLLGFLLYSLLEQKRIYTWCVPVWLGAAGLITLISYYVSAREGIYTIGEIKDDVVTPLGPNNYVACYLMMLLPLGAVYLYRSRGYQRFVYGICVLVGFAGFLVTFSRGAVTSFLVALLLSLRLMYRSGFRVRHAAIVLAFLASIVAVFPQQIAFGVYDFVESKIAVGDESRIELWQKALTVFEKHPILGVGPGQFVNYSGEIGNGNSKLGAHSTYLQTLAESGILGSIPIFGLIFVSLWRLHRWASSSLHPVQVATWIGILAAMIHNAVDSLFWTQHFQALFWLMTAIAISTARTHAAGIRLLGAAGEAAP